MSLRLPNCRLWMQACLMLTILSCVALNQARSQVTNDSIIVILQKDEQQPPLAERIRSVTITGEQFSEDCAYYELLLQARKMAVNIGANLFRIDARRNHSKTQRCDALDVSFYRAANPRENERSFIWSAARPLDWDDFRGPVRAAAGPQAAAETSCGIAIETNLVSNEGIAKVYVFNTFDKKESWVREDRKVDEVLEHEQGHWNICELYTRKMQARFDALRIVGSKLNATVTEVYNEIGKEYEDRQQQYETETLHGTNPVAQRRWTAMINNELTRKLTDKL